MTTLREQAEKVLATCRLQRCSIGYSENTGEYEAGSCEADATHRITSPHDDRRWDYCEKCAREEHAKIEYNHRWSLGTIPGLEGFLAAQELARATAATKGPWEDAQGSVWENGARKVTEEFVRCPGDNVALAADIIDPRTSQPSPDNSKFIAHAREDVPALALAVIALSDRLLAIETDTPTDALDALTRVIETTHGPWRVKGNDVLAPDDVDCPRGYNPENIVAECRTPEDAEFFAHAKDDVIGLAKKVAALSKRLVAVESALRNTLSKCNHCDELATRGYHHVSGHHMVVCDNDRCHEENFCDECGQVWYGDGPRCEAFKDGGVPCTGTSKHAKSTAYHLRDLPYAAVIRSLR